MGTSKSNEDIKKKNQISSSNNDIQNNPINPTPTIPVENNKLSANEIKKEIIAEPKQTLEEKELKIELFPKNVPRSRLTKRHVFFSLPLEKLGGSLDDRNKLAFVGANVPLLEGFYSAHCNHYPIRIKPDDIWLLIIQAFSNHVNANSEQLRKYFVNFDGKKTLKVNYGKIKKENVDKKILEDFSIQMNKQIEKFIGKNYYKF